MPTLGWYASTLIATIACLPMTLFLFRRTMGQGAGFARPIAMLLTIWPVWFLSHIFDEVGMWSGPILWAFVVLIGVVGWIQISRRKIITRETVFHFAVAELVFVIVFIAALWFRGFGPQITDTEKPGELMMLSSVMHSTNMPPSDAWLSGHSLNYYYLGYAIFGGFGKMTSLAPAGVFNLALVTTFATTFVAAAGLVASVLGRFYGEWSARIGGIIAATMLLLLGNPWSTLKILRGEAGNGYWGEGLGWNASRIIRDSNAPDYGYNPITEFPSFSFILGDLHPHVMALPFAVTALGLAWVLLTLGPVTEGENFWRRDGVRIGVAGAFLGSLYALNSWDFPTYAGIAAFALILGTIGLGWKSQVGALAILGVGAIIPWIPFHLNFVAPASPVDSAFGDVFGNIPIVGGVLESIGFYRGLATTPGEFLSIFGFQYAALLALLIGEVIRRRSPILSMRLRREGERPYHDPVSGYLALGFGVLCLLGAIVVPVHLLLFCGLPVIVIWLLMERDARLTPANISLVIFAFALLLLLIPEFFYISDIYTGSRMNTVFKVSYQVWLLMSVASGVALVALWKSIRFNAVLRVAMPAVTAAVLVLGLGYPVVAGQQWLDWRNPTREWSGIDGLEYLKTAPDSPEAAEYEAIAWLREHADTDDVILTAGGGEWDGAVARISGGTGVPTLIGWTGHERQWHLGDDETLAEIPTRVGDIDAMYAGPPDPALLDKYGITFIYMGPIEVQGSNYAGSAPREGYMAQNPVPTASDLAFPGDGWELVFEQGDVRIYQRIQD